MAKIYSFISVILLITLYNLPSLAGSSFEVAPGIYVTKTTYSAPINEQPFFGFAEKSLEQKQADKLFLASLDEMKISKATAFSRAISHGWQAIRQKDLGEAARRFNQAHLITPGHPSIFHGFAVIVHLRFQDTKFASDLFRIGSRLKQRKPGYMADYGRFLLITDKPIQAEAVLTQAVRDQPQNATAWSNLAWAKFHSGKTKAACKTASKVKDLNPNPRIVHDLKLLQHKAQCDN